MEYRIEKDSLGEVKVEADKLWGAQTQRSLENFVIGEKMPYDMIRAIVTVKRCAAKANFKAGKLSEDKCKRICDACDKVLGADYADSFPLVVYQTGSGTQTNMNVNEVLAHLAGVHPNDDCNMSQSTNDVFPTAIHVMAVLNSKKLIGCVDSLCLTFKKLEKA